MSGLAMMPWFPRDFIASTRAMRLAERGAYRDLLDYQWEMGKLPSDPDRLSRLLGCSLQEFNDVWPAIADKFQLVDGFLANQRLEEHRERAIRQRDKKVSAAAATNAKRYGSPTSLSESVSVSLSASPPSPSPSPSKNKEPEEEQRAFGADVAKRVAKRGSRIDVPFPITSPMRSWALSEFPNVNLEATTAEFEDFWKGVPGAKGCKLDWEATWRNRVREVAGRSGRNNGKGGRELTKFERVTAHLPKEDQGFG